MPARKLKGAWWVDFRFNGQRIRKKSPVDTKRGAEDHERAMRLDLANRPRVTGQPTGKPETCSAFFWRWYATEKGRYKPSEQANKESVIRLHLAPFFGTDLLTAVNWPERIDQFTGQQISKGLTRKTVNNHLCVLSRALKMAAKWGALPSKPEVEWMKVPPARFDFLTAEESDRLLEAAAGRPRFQPFGIGNAQAAVLVMTALRSGLRRGELIALRWQDVDFTAGKIRVELNDWEGKLGSPKGGKAREVPMSPQLAATLKGHRHLRGPWVFCHEDGTRLHRNRLHGIMPSICRRAGLRVVQWHVLRHSFASQLVMGGVPLKVVQELLGHATIQMTMKYAHLSPAMHAQAVALLDRAPDGHQVGTGWGWAPVDRAKVLK